MRVRVTFDVDDHGRYVMAKYFGSKTARGQSRTRATRREVKEFIIGATAWAVREHANALRGRSRAAAKRLADGPRETVAPVAAPAEHQPSLLFGESH